MGKANALPNDLMTRATGEPTLAKYRIEYLREKYGAARR
jgi:Zn-dependent M32 family carboxypeptidase